MVLSGIAIVIRHFWKRFGLQHNFECCSFAFERLQPFKGFLYCHNCNVWQVLTAWAACCVEVVYFAAKLSVCSIYVLVLSLMYLFFVCVYTVNTFLHRKYILTVCCTLAKTACTDLSPRCSSLWHHLCCRVYLRLDGTSFVCYYLPILLPHCSPQLPRTASARSSLITTESTSAYCSPNTLSITCLGFILDCQAHRPPLEAASSSAASSDRIVSSTCACSSSEALRSLTASLRPYKQTPK